MHSADWSCRRAIPKSAGGPGPFRCRTRSPVSLGICRGSNPSRPHRRSGSDRAEAATGGHFRLPQGRVRSPRRVHSHPYLPPRQSRQAQGNGRGIDRDRHSGYRDVPLPLFDRRVIFSVYRMRGGPAAVFNPERRRSPEFPPTRRLRSSRRPRPPPWSENCRPLPPSMRLRFPSGRTSRASCRRHTRSSR
jgi:hypothetical protein